MDRNEALRAALRVQEEKRARLFSGCTPFSAHLRKWTDARLPDMYDHNTFEMSGIPEEAELLASREHQRAAGASFWRLEGDGLIVDPDARGRYVATTLLAGIAERLGGQVYLHADRDDTPRRMYEAMGFVTLDELYEYYHAL